MNPPEPWPLVEWWDHFDTHYKLMSSGIVYREMAETWLPVAETIRQVSIADYARWICSSPNLIVRKLQPQLLIFNDPETSKHVNMERGIFDDRD